MPVSNHSHPRLPTVRAAVCIILFAAGPGPARAAGPFQDVTAQVGLGGAGGAAAWGDFDNDGWVDLYTDGTLWHNEAGKRFSRIQGQPLSGGKGMWGDYDNDGWLDLYCTGNHKLFHNQAGEGFRDVSSKLPARPMGNSRGAVWGDFDGDGDLDLYVGGWEVKGQYQPDARYRNNGDGTFEQVWVTPGRKQPARGVTAADFDEDGDLDVYVSNYRLEINLLWRNDGTGNFDQVSVEYGTAGDDNGYYYSFGHTIGSAFGDLDDDGHLDLFVGNFSHAHKHQDRPKFLRNLGPAGEFHFEDKSAEAGLVRQESFASPTLGDYDNDGYLDLFFTTVYSGDHSVLYRNNGDWTFTDVTAAAGFGTLRTYQAAWADYDNDGDLDLVAGGKLFRNPGNQHHWLKVRLEGAGKVNRSAIGAQVRIRIGDRTLTRQVAPAVGEGNQNDLTLHFGLGEHKDPVELEILWPGGTRRSLKTPVDRTVQVKFNPG